MKTQKERFIELLKEFGIEFDIEGDNVVIGEGQGYLGFYGKFIFDKNGNFISHSLLE